MFKFSAGFELKISSWFCYSRTEDEWIIQTNILFKHFAYLETNFCWYWCEEQWDGQWTLSIFRVMLKYFARFRPNISADFVIYKEINNEYFTPTYCSSILVAWNLWFRADFVIFGHASNVNFLGRLFSSIPSLTSEDIK